MSTKCVRDWCFEPVEKPVPRIGHGHWFLGVVSLHPELPSNIRCRQPPSCAPLQRPSQPDLSFFPLSFTLFTVFMISKTVYESCLLFIMKDVVYYEPLKREIKTKPIYEFR